MIADVFSTVQQMAELVDLKGTHHLGSEFLSLNEPAPRIVWVPTTTTFRRGKVQVGPGATQSPRSLWTAQHGIDVHLWSKAATDDVVAELLALEKLQQRFVSALHHAAYGSYELQGATFTAQGSEPDATYGRHLILRIVLLVPVVEEGTGETYVKITTEHDRGILGSPGTSVPVNLP